MKNILQDVNNYYSKKINCYGNTPKGVDWKDEAGQILRFEQIVKIINQKDNFSINDIGCGYGRLYSYLKENNYKNFDYIGYDISEEMIKVSRELYKNDNNSNFIKIENMDEIVSSDYIAASGIFNVKLNHNEQNWQDYILNTLDIMNKKSIKGFSFNILTSYADKEYMKDSLYYADSLFYFDYCKKNFSKNIALLHDYDLYEFTILVRR